MFIPVLHSVDPTKYQLLIFNRWGEVVFQTSDVNKGWDGRHNGILVPIDVYVWKISYKEENGFRNFTKEGHVNVIR